MDPDIIEQYNIILYTFRPKQFFLIILESEVKYILMLKLKNKT